MKKTAVSSQKFAPGRGLFAEPLRALRMALGETQEALARRIGVSLRGYTQWERGETSPRGKWLLKIIELCPDLEMRARFGIAIDENFRVFIPRHLPKPKGEEQEELLREYSDAAEGLNLIFEAAMADQEGAKILLSDLADKLTTRGGNWSKMKYLRMLKGGSR